MKNQTIKSVLIIVAHPDDETLWAGGAILDNPSWVCFIISLCRRDDTDRAPKFNAVLQALNAKGIMGNLDDGADQIPLKSIDIQALIRDLLPKTDFDLVITHNLSGEYTKHLRHEEVSKAVMQLWRTDEIKASTLWAFAYEDGNKAYFPTAVAQAHVYNVLPEPIWLKKYALITETYGFKKDSWEAKTTPKAEAFWVFQKENNASFSINH